MAGTGVCIKPGFVTLISMLKSKLEILGVLIFFQGIIIETKGFVL